MASAPFQSGQVAPPPHPHAFPAVDWGGAVRGSPASFQSTDAACAPAGGAAPAQPTQGQSPWHPTPHATAACEYAAPAAPPGPGSYPQPHDPSWHHQTHSHVFPTDPGPRPPAPPWQHPYQQVGCPPQQPSYNSNYYQYDYVHQQYPYQQQYEYQYQYGQQHVYPHPHQQAWSGYPGRSATQGPTAAAGAAAFASAAGVPVTATQAAAAAAAAAAHDQYDPLADSEQAPTAASSAAAAAAAGAPATVPAHVPTPPTAAAESAAAGRPSGGGSGGRPDGSAPAGAATPAAMPAPPSVDLVVVWDLDETLIIFNSLLSGAFAAAAETEAARAEVAKAAAAAAAASTAAAAAVAVAGPAGSAGPPPPPPSGASDLRDVAQRAAALGRDLAELVFSFCDDHMDFKKFEEMDPTSFLELWAAAAAGAAGSGGGGGPTAIPGAAAASIKRATLERIAEVYGGGAAGLADVIGEAGCRTRASMLAEAERLTGGWVAAGRRLLAGVKAAAAASTAHHQPVVLGFRTVRHVLVSAGHLVATLGKLVLWGLDDFFDIRDVYSASGRPKLEIFRALRGRFGPTVAYAAVGDGREEERAAAVMGWGFVRVGPREEAGGGDAAPLTAGGGAGLGVGGAVPPGRAARPILSIRPEDVLDAARAAY